MRMKDDDKQQRIKQAVMKLILEEGFAGTSISKIARLAGVSPATVYIYYENKEEMLKDIYTEYSGDIFSYLVRCVDAGMPAGYFIDTLMRNYYSYISEHEEKYMAEGVKIKYGVFRMKPEAPDFDPTRYHLKRGSDA